MLEKEFKYFKANHSLLFDLYPNKHVVIKDEKVHFASDSFNEALEFAKTNFELGTFLIQFCSETTEGYTQTFHSRAIFA
jgi:hypothetical protein